jgi:hypothetical protein
MAISPSKDRGMGIPSFQPFLGPFMLMSVVWLGWISPVLGAVYQGTPTTYQQLLPLLRPGDTLLLQPGLYDDPKYPPGLALFDLHGTADDPIVITGPEEGPPVIFVGRSTHNTIRVDRSSYLIVRNLEVNGRDRGGDGVKAQGLAHHITLENLFIHGVGQNQSVVGISTNGGTTWNWIIRGCVIQGAGTGMYLGNSDGTMPFIGGLIEYNVFQDSIGYNVQIKHQIKQPVFPEFSSGPHASVIRHNIFTKSGNSSKGSMSRPNLLVGHFPITGLGQEDQYQIYGNVFYQNPSGESLLQAEGNVSVYHNLFLNSYGSGIWIIPHNHQPRKIFVFQNTVVARDRGILVQGLDKGFPQVVAANAVFAGSGIKAKKVIGNFTAGFPAASDFLAHPFDELGKWDLFPKEHLGTLDEHFEWQWPKDLPDVNLDFNGMSATNGMVGAYAGMGENPGTIPDLENKLLMSPNAIPGAPSRLRIE